MKSKKAETKYNNIPFQRTRTTKTTSTMLLTTARGFIMECVSLDSTAMYSHVLALFVIYLFVRYYRTLKFIGPDFVESDDSQTGSKQAATSLMSKPKVCASISYGKKREIDKSAMLPSTSPFFKPGETQCDHDDAILSLLEKNSSLELESTLSERRRFLVACKGNVMAATNRLDHYLQWNNEHVEAKIVNKIRMKPTRDRDYDLWAECCLTAMKISGEVENIVLPRIIRKLHRKDKCRVKFSDDDDKKNDFRDREGHRIFCFRPALMDTKLAKSSTYTSAVAIYFDRSCNREKSEKITVCVDVRAGRGWPNTHVVRLIPFMKHCMKLLLPLFPERLHRALLYPVPHAFFYVWKMISKCMDPLTVQRVCVLEGKCKIVAPPPIQKLRVYFGEEEMERLEATRTDNFKA